MSNVRIAQRDVKKDAKQKAKKSKIDHVQFSSDGRRKSKIEHVQISDEIISQPLTEIRPSPENDKLYKPVDPNDPDFRAFVAQVRVNGITDPLITTIDGYICSGHRRYAAAGIVGIDPVPCRTANLYHDDPRFLPFLRACNRQRVKTLDEVLREEIVSADPEEAHRLLREYREEQAKVDADTIALGDSKSRARITVAKRPLLEAICANIEKHNKIGKLSVRQIFYLLLNENPPPLIHAGKPDSVYKNNLKCYRAVDESFTSRLMRMETCGCGQKGSRMLPLYADPWFTFRFADDRLILRFHLEGVQAGRQVSVFKSTPAPASRRR